LVQTGTFFFSSPEGAKLQQVLLKGALTLRHSHNKNPTMVESSKKDKLNESDGRSARVFSRQDLESEVWGDVQGTSDTLHAHMYELRYALKSASGYGPIETVHSLGYR
jgi:hypothetical protein